MPGFVGRLQIAHVFTHSSRQAPRARPTRAPSRRQAHATARARTVGSRGRCRREKGELRRGDDVMRPRRSPCEAARAVGRTVAFDETLEECVQFVRCRRPARACLPLPVDRAAFQVRTLDVPWYSDFPNPQHLVGKDVHKNCGGSSDKFYCRHRRRRLAPINHALDVDVRSRFKLEITPLRLGGEFVFQRPVRYQSERYCDLQ